MADVTTPAENATSKTAWVQYAGLISMLLAYFGFDIPEEMLAGVLVAVGTITTFVTWVITTYFTKRVAPVAQMRMGLVGPGDQPGTFNGKFMAWLTTLVTGAWGVFLWWVKSGAPGAQ